MSDVPNIKSTGSFCREEELEVVLDNRSEKLSEYKKRYGTRLILWFYFTPYYMVFNFLSSSQSVGFGGQPGREGRQSVGTTKEVGLLDWLKVYHVIHSLSFIEKRQECVL